MAAASASFTVILADRNKHIRELLARELARSGYAVKDCGLGKEAVSLASAGGDLLVVDLELPDMDALSVIRQVRRTRPRLPVAVHAHGSDEAGLTLDEPLVYFVPRGADPAILVRAVRVMLEMARAGTSSGGSVPEGGQG